MSRLAAPVRGLRDGEGIHYLPNDNRRFPICGSWRSNWNHTAEADRATCPDCRARLAQGPPPDGAAD
jgi:hypothetical protein